VSGLLRVWRGVVTLGVGLVILLDMSPGAPAQAPLPGGWREVAAGSSGIRMAIPPSWSEAAGGREPGPALAASAPGGLPSVAIIVRPAPPGESVDSVAARIAGAQAASLRGARVSRPEPSRLGGLEARRVTMAWEDRRRGPMDGVELIALRGTEAVIAVAQWARSPRASADRAVAERVLATVTVGPRSQGGPGARAALPAPPPPERAGGGSLTARGAGGPRRNIFLEPPQAMAREGSKGRAPSAGGGGASGGSPLPLPPVPEALGPGAALPPPPGAVPVPKGAGGAGQAGSPPAVIGLVLGPTPEAVLASGTSRTIVAPGARTPWGTVVAVTRAGVVLATGSGRVTLRVAPRGGKACVEQSPPSSCS
jgi:hypothetical protein